MSPADDGERDLGEVEPERRSRLHRVLTVAIPALVIVGLLAYGLLRPAPEGPGGAPEFELTRLDGETLSDDDLRGRPVVLNFWASWCIPCREEMPAFQKMWERYRDDGLQIVGVNVQDSREAAAQFVDQLGVTYPNVFDGDEELARKLDVLGLPQTFFITSDYELQGAGSRPTTQVIEEPSGPDGTMVFGAISEKDLEERIRALLENDQ